MLIKVAQYSLPKNDHLWLEKTTSSEYIDDYCCDGCQSKMDVVSRITNIHGAVGLITGLCPDCGYTKRVRNLSPDSFRSHFSKRWLSAREEELSPNTHVYNQTRSQIQPKGSVLDVGCGIGTSLLAFQNNGYDVYGVEPSEHRSRTGFQLMPNIETGTAEDYLFNTTKEFDLIYFYDVLQFLKNPYTVLEQASKRLTKNGKIWFKLGIYHHRSNLCQFAHFSVLRNYINLYSLLSHFDALGIYPVNCVPEPFELTLSKTPNSMTDKILKSAKKLDLDDLTQYARKSLKLFQLKIFQRCKISYLKREVKLKMGNPSTPVLPITFVHNTDHIPLLLK
jgi:SAM-dependent methyltransferase